MGVRNTANRDFSQELARVKRRVDQAIFELTEARNRLSTNQASPDEQTSSGQGESELATLCISLELSLADATAWAHRLADKVRGSDRAAVATGSRR